MMDLVRKGSVAAYRRAHAQIPLFTDEAELGTGLGDPELAERVGLTIEPYRDCVNAVLNEGLMRR